MPTLATFGKDYWGIRVKAFSNRATHLADNSICFYVLSSPFIQAPITPADRQTD